MGLELVSQSAQPETSLPPALSPHILLYMTLCDVCGNCDIVERASGSEGNHSSLFQRVLQVAGGSAVTVVEWNE